MEEFQDKIIVSTPRQAFPVKLFNKFKKTTVKLHQTNLNLKYNKICSANNIIPNYIKINVNNMSPAAQRAKRTAETAWLKYEISSLYSKKQELNVSLYKLHLELGNHISSSSVLYDTIERINHHSQSIMQRKWQKQEQKLNKLLNKNCSKTETHTQHTFHERLVNFTDITLTKEEQQLLEKGPKYNLNTHITHKTIENLITETEYIIGQHEKTNTRDFNPGLTRELVTEEMKQIIRRNKPSINTNKKTADEKTINSIHRKLKQHNALITKADKGNALVLITKAEYIEKTEKFLTENKISKLTSDPTQRYQRNVKTLLKNITHTLTQNQTKRMTQKNPKAPLLTSLPKVHKPLIPVRPVVDFRKAPSYLLGRHMHTFLQKTYTYTNNRSLKNTGDIIEKIKNINIPPTAKLVSFDITSMYTNIPTEETINIIEQQLKCKKFPDIQINEISSILRLITEQNYFTFNNNFYSQQEGLPMGSPISGTLANIFLDHIENTIFNNIVKQGGYKIIYWYRYVDDIICLVDETHNRIEELHSNINTVHPQIHFTMEIEKNQTLNFLDLTITRNNHQHEFSIYRKPTSTSTVIHNTSNHPTVHKYASFTHMLHRINRTPLKPENYTQELNIIKQIAVENNYKTDIINKLNNKIKRKQAVHTDNTADHTTQANRGRWYTLTYNNKISHRIGNILKKQGIPITFRTNNTVQKRLRPDRKTADKFSNAGIYQLTCNSCQAQYIGQTSRNFRTRYTEHMRALKSDSTHSTFADHLMNKNHNPTNIENDLHILKNSNSLYQQLTIEENYYIQKAIVEGKNVINEYTTLCNNTLFTALRELAKDSEQTSTHTQ
ncbi:uncharacterized protein LOC126267492 [Schistocerca gregaria]|uniref:uncharacterized protein LOC126267492 n=1 Tax=Schistocerca gregaria TaxID=7010 RepID=UPI00211EA24A|nr:uncharacterized protein LOC126267492 [Schistocerca gregaria]